VAAIIPWLRVVAVEYSEEGTVFAKTAASCRSAKMRKTKMAWILAVVVAAAVVHNACASEWDTVSGRDKTG
jgi:hypothetical protein